MWRIASRHQEWYPSLVSGVSMWFCASVGHHLTVTVFTRATSTFVPVSLPSLYFKLHSPSMDGTGRKELNDTEIPICALSLIDMID